MRERASKLRAVLLIAMTLHVACALPPPPGSRAPAADVVAGDVASPEVGVVDARELDVSTGDVSAVDGTTRDAPEAAEVATPDVLIAVDVPADASVIDAMIADVVMADVVMADSVMVDAVTVDAVTVDAVTVDAVTVDAVTVDAPMDAVRLDAVPTDINTTDLAVLDAVVDVAPDVPRDVPWVRAQRSCTPMVAGCGLVEIPGGTFTQGEGEPSVNAAPAQSTTVGNFAIDAYEVTVARFNAFWAVRPRDLATVRATPVAYPGGQRIEWLRPGFVSPAMEPPARSTHPNWNWAPSPSPRDAHPMNGASWWLAMEFCVWDGGRLPTEAEWEFVARGRGDMTFNAGRAYPWGDADPEFSCTSTRAQWNFCAGADAAATQPVGVFPRGSVFGVHDLAGNVAEWTADIFGVYPSCRVSNSDPLCNDASTERVIRGGAWNNDVPNGLRAAARVRYAATDFGASFGFRCARTMP